MTSDNKNQPDFNEQEEPKLAPGSVPIWMYVLVFAMGYLGLNYLESQGGGFHAKVYNPHSGIDYVKAIQPGKGDDPFALGQGIYIQFCQPCHQPNGSGAPGVAPPLAGSEWVTAEGAERLSRIVLHGLKGPIVVKGQEWNLAMLPWKDVLNDKQIAAVLTFIRGNEDWGNKAAPVDEALVAGIRNDTSSRSLNWTAEELLAIPLGQ